MQNRKIIVRRELPMETQIMLKKQPVAKGKLMTKREPRKHCFPQDGDWLAEGEECAKDYLNGFYRPDKEEPFVISCYGDFVRCTSKEKNECVILFKPHCRLTSKLNQNIINDYGTTWDWRINGIVLDTYPLDQAEDDSRYWFGISKKSIGFVNYLFDKYGSCGEDTCISCKTYKNNYWRMKDDFLDYGSSLQIKEGVCLAKNLLENDYNMGESIYLGCEEGGTTIITDSYRGSVFILYNASLSLRNKIGGDLLHSKYGKPNPTELRNITTNRIMLKKINYKEEEPRQRHLYYNHGAKSVVFYEGFCHEINKVDGVCSVKDCQICKTDPTKGEN